MRADRWLLMLDAASREFQIRSAQFHIGPPSISKHFLTIFMHRAIAVQLNHLANRPSPSHFWLVEMSEGIPLPLKDEPGNLRLHLSCIQFFTS